MPQPHSPSDRPAPKLPFCAACGKFMRLSELEPTHFYVNLDQVRFVCECGRDSVRFLARE